MNERPETFRAQAEADRAQAEEVESETYRDYLLLRARWNDYLEEQARWRQEGEERP